MDIFYLLGIGRYFASIILGQQNWRSWKYYKSLSVCIRFLPCTLHFELGNWYILLIINMYNLHLIDVFFFRFIDMWRKIITIWLLSLPALFRQYCIAISSIYILQKVSNFFPFYISELHTSTNRIQKNIEPIVYSDFSGRYSLFRSFGTVFNQNSPDSSRGIDTGLAKGVKI